MQVKDLKHNPNNPRIIEQEKLQMLKKEMKEFGDLSGIVLNVRTNRLVGGHQRTKVFSPTWAVEKEPCTDKTGTVSRGVVKTSYGDWTYREVDWPEDKEYMANIAANKQLAEFDMPKVKDILEQFDTGDIDITLSGFGMEEIEALMTQFHVETGEDEKKEKGKILRGEFEILINCMDENDQQKKYEELIKLGYECQILT